MKTEGFMKELAKIDTNDINEYTDEVRSVFEAYRMHTSAGIRMCVDYIKEKGWDNLAKTIMEVYEQGYTLQSEKMISDWARKHGGI